MLGICENESLCFVQWLRNGELSYDFVFDPHLIPCYQVNILFTGCSYNFLRVQSALSFDFNNTVILLVPKPDFVRQVCNFDHIVFALSLDICIL